MKKEHGLNKGQSATKRAIPINVWEFIKELFADARYGATFLDWYLMGALGAIGIFWLVLGQFGGFVGHFLAVMFLFFELSHRGFIKKQSEFYQEKFDWYHSTLLKQCALMEDMYKKEFFRQTGFSSTPQKDLH